MQIVTAGFKKAGVMKVIKVAKNAFERSERTLQVVTICRYTFVSLENL